MPDFCEGVHSINYCSSEFNEELPEKYSKILHLYDIWHWIKVKEGNLFKDFQSLHITGGYQGFMGGQ